MSYTFEAKGKVVPVPKGRHIRKRHASDRIEADYPVYGVELITRESKTGMSYTELCHILVLEDKLARGSALEECLFRSNPRFQGSGTTCREILADGQTREVRAKVEDGSWFTLRPRSPHVQPAQATPQATPHNPAPEPKTNPELTVPTGPTL